MQIVKKLVSIAHDTVYRIPFFVILKKIKDWILEIFEGDFISGFDY
jgi:hypothetical protein